MRNAEIGALAVSSAHGQGNMIYYGSHQRKNFGRHSRTGDSPSQGQQRLGRIKRQDRRKCHSCNQGVVSQVSVCYDTALPYKRLRAV